MASAAIPRQRERSTKASIPPVIHAIGGSLGSAFALWLLYPLERARIELQQGASSSSRPTATDELGENNDKEEEEEECWQDAMTETSGLAKIENRTTVDDSHETTGVSNDEGIVDCIRRLHRERILYQGASNIILTVGISNFVFFFFNEFLKQHLGALNNSPKKKQQCKLPPGLALLASSLAGICNVLITNPFWVANMNLIHSQDASSSIGTELSSIVRERGWVHLWAGTGASLLLVSNPILQFFVYEELKTQSSTTPMYAFVTGAVAKLVATVATYPLQLSQTLLRTDNTYKNTMDCLIKLYQRSGYRALFRGMKAKMLQTVLTAAFTFLTYEQIVTALVSAIATVQTKALV